MGSHGKISTSSFRLIKLSRGNLKALYAPSFASVMNSKGECIFLCISKDAEFLMKRFTQGVSSVWKPQCMKYNCKRTYHGRDERAYNRNQSVDPNDVGMKKIEIQYKANRETLT